MSVFQFHIYSLTNFLSCWPDVLAQEGPYPNDWSNPANYSDTPGDPGGRTMDGIIQTEYDAYRESLGEATQPVINISKPEGEAIYLNSYWLPNVPSLQNGLNLSVFDTNVNMGPGQGTEILQYVLGIPVDGIWGPQTAAAVAGISNVVSVINAYTARREAVYMSFGTFPEFGSDWINRAVTIDSQSLAMAGEAMAKRSPAPPVKFKRCVKAPTWFDWYGKLHRPFGGVIATLPEYTAVANALIPDINSIIATNVPKVFQGMVPAGIVSSSAGMFAKTSVDTLVQYLNANPAVADRLGLKPKA